MYDNTYVNTNHWVVEQQPNGHVFFNKNKLEIIDAKGCTVWFKHKLKAPIMIEYDATVIDKKGPFDRVSDLNCFWMANDPYLPNDFFKNSENRKGLFENYHNLQLYYVGYGGHNNTKTRFRKYNGNINRPLRKEHDLSAKKYMIVPNKKTHITLTVRHNYVSYQRDGEIIFELHDKSPYLSGYFGFRTVNSHLLIENFNIKKK
ncbi:DUF6250 domain-containing protein [Wenyingzhuangia sp. 1_MG-2023]|nr:DUF6250 domain-containing protein [Wenyingzhuangia sp. 1_MG-2023]